MNGRDTGELARRFLLERHEHALLELAKHELKTDDLQVALRTLSAAAGKTMNVERASIWMFDDERTKITCLDLYELSSANHSKGTELFASDHPTYFAALEENRTLVATDARTDERTRDLSSVYLVPNRVASMLDAPIRLDGKVVGIVCHEHIDAVRSWTTEEQRFAGSMADMAALALEHVERIRAEREVQRRDELLDGVAKAANRMFAEAEAQVSHRDALLAALSSAAAALCASETASDGVDAALEIAREALSCTIVAVVRAVDIDPALRSYLEVLRGGLAVTVPVDGGSRYVVPVRTSVGFWGYVEATAGEEREWAKPDEHFLQTLGHAIAAALTSRA